MIGSNSPGTTYAMSTTKGGHMLIDTTLREGAQMFATSIPQTERAAIAAWIADMGVEELEVGWVGQDGLKEVLRVLRDRGATCAKSVWAPCRPLDMYRAAGLDIDTVNIGLPVSDGHITKRLRTNRNGLLRMLRQTMAVAHSCGIGRLSVGLEDVSRADMGFALHVARVARSLGAARIRLADTLGVLTPGRMAEMVQKFTSLADIEIAVHCHNDFGMATANAVAALDAGAHWTDVSVLGIGERSGISALEEVAGYLRLVRGSAAYDLLHVRKLCRMVAAHAGIPVARNRPMTGDDIFAVESGLHVDGLIKNPELFEPYDPAQTGAHRILALGVKSGRGAVKAVLGQLGIEASTLPLSSLLNTIRDRAARSGRPLHPTEIRQLLPRND